jgi:hypothetical protein
LATPAQEYYILIFSISSFVKPVNPEIISIARPFLSPAFAIFFMAFSLSDFTASALISPDTS